MNDNIVRVGIPARPRLCTDDIREHGFATRFHSNLIVGILASESFWLAFCNREHTTKEQSLSIAALLN